MAALVTPLVPIVGLSPSSSFFLGLAKVASVEPQVPSLCRTVVFPTRIIVDVGGLNLMVGAGLRHQWRWIVKTESNVRKEPRLLPEPSCTICKGPGKVRCSRCSGQSRLNFKEKIMWIAETSTSSLLFFTILTVIFHCFLPHDLINQVKTLHLIAFVNSCLQILLCRLS
jgi:hypothetical protein